MELICRKLLINRQNFLWKLMEEEIIIIIISFLYNWYKNDEQMKTTKVVRRRKDVVTDYEKETRTLFLRVTEEIDQHTADKIRRKLDSEIEIYSPKKVIFDFNGIEFMDSSGIGMVLGRYKLVKMLGGTFEIINVNKRLKRIFDMSGVSRIIDIKDEESEKNERVI